MNLVQNVARNATRVISRLVSIFLRRMVDMDEVETLKELAEVLPESPVKKVKPGHVAFIEYFGGPNEPRHVGVLEALTKKELRSKLADPKISQVFSIVRGRRVQFLETRNISF